jgi:hypothetical protein
VWRTCHHGLCCICMYLLLTKCPSIVLSTSRKSRTVSTYNWDLRATREERGRSEGKYVGKNLLSYFRTFVFSYSSKCLSTYSMYFAYLLVNVTVLPPVVSSGKNVRASRTQNTNCCSSPYERGRKRRKKGDTETAGLRCGSLSYPATVSAVC